MISLYANKTSCILLVMILLDVFAHAEMSTIETIELLISKLKIIEMCTSDV